MFYWSEGNFRVFEEEIECTITECYTFTPNIPLHLQHGSIATDDGRFFYVHADKRVDFFHVYETDELILEWNMSYLLDDSGKVSLYNKKKKQPYQMTYITDVCLDFYQDVDPEEMRFRDSKQVVMVGRVPEDKKGMHKIQDYNDSEGWRSIWIDDYTMGHPIIIQEGIEYNFLPEDILGLLYDISDVADELNAESERNSIGYKVTSYWMDFIYGDHYYRLYPNATALTYEAFHDNEDKIKRCLIEMGCPYVQRFYKTSWD